MSRPGPGVIPGAGAGDEAIRGHWQDVAGHWRDNLPERLWRSHADQINADWLAGRLPKEPVQRLLKTDLFDEAATAGLYPLLARHARVVVGMDLSSTTAQGAGTRACGLRAICADARALPFADASFDVIVSNSTLDHFPTPTELDESLLELRRVLKPGGELLISLDNRANPVVALRNAIPFHWLRRLRIMPYYVGFTCGPKGLRQRLERDGWEIREMGAILHCPRFFSIHATLFLERWASPAVQQRFIRWLAGFERLAGWPTRYVTGYFVTARAVRRV
ncbi:MAG: class I SAM-dependent methyltransferase [Candidatus Eisenbacteria bacterium]|nr:class I SAM-dependent methyltransferase [Candidatus Eisenbacteria bacterium]